MHAHDIAEWLGVLTCRSLVLIHLSRRTNVGSARKQLSEAIGAERMERVEILMDHRTNRQRYDRQLAAAEEASQREHAPD